jgi:hypothetical protein
MEIQREVTLHNHSLKTPASIYKGKKIEEFLISEIYSTEICTANFFIQIYHNTAKCIVIQNNHMIYVHVLLY